MIGRRGFVLGGMTACVGWSSAGARLDEPDPGDYVGRRFRVIDRQAPVSELIVVVYAVDDEAQAAKRASTLVRSATLPNGMTGTSIVDVQTFPTSSVSGTLATWTEVEGAVETLRAGMFCWRETYTWSVVATGTETEAMSQMVTGIARDLWTRQSPASIEDLWMLLPREADLDEEFREVDTFGRRQPEKPAGTPIPDEAV